MLIFNNQQTLDFLSIKKQKKLLALKEESLTSSQVLPSLNPPDGQKKAWTENWMDRSLFTRRPESPDKMAAALTVMNERLIQGKIHSAEPLNPNLR